MEGTAQQTILGRLIASFPEADGAVLAAALDESVSTGSLLGVDPTQVEEWARLRLSVRYDD